MARYGVAGLIKRNRLADMPSVTDPMFYFKEVVVGVDPAMSNKEGADETGIIVFGLGNDGHGYVLADYSGRYSPAQWARNHCECLP